MLLLNNGLNPNGYTEDILIFGSLRTTGKMILKDEIHIKGNFEKQSLYFGDDDKTRIYANTDGTDRFFFIDPGNETSDNQGCAIYSALAVNGDLIAHGKKNRAVETKNYGTVKMNAFETAEAYFADIGSGIIPEMGCIRIYFDAVFAETIDCSAEYHIFITNTNEKRTQYIRKEKGYFVVYGDPGATFDWMLCAKQSDYTALRMESERGFPKPPVDFDDSIFEHDDDALKIVESAIFQCEREVDLL